MTHLRSSQLNRGTIILDLRDLLYNNRQRRRFDAVLIVLPSGAQANAEFGGCILAQVNPPDRRFSHLTT
jgi:hypothetical protein